jgi:hypothetical protein
MRDAPPPQGFARPLLLLAAALALNLPAMLPASAPLVVDLAIGDGPATQRASGILWGLSGTKPEDALIESLKPQLYRSRISLWRQGTGLESFERMAEMGCRLQVVLSDEYSVRFADPGQFLETNDDFGYPNITRWPGDEGDFELWDRVVRETFEYVRQTGLTVQWDVWEEPNYKGWWGASKEQFFETWARTYRLLKSLDPEAELVGPSLNHFDPDYLQEFLLFAQEEDVLPDILSWHEIIPEHSPRSIARHAREIRAFMAENNILIDRIDINEFVSHDRMLDPGMHVWYLTYLERAKVHGAAKATWVEEESGIYNAWTSTLGGLLTYPDLQPRATWWVFKRYAEITGELVRTEGNRYVAGLAGVDVEEKKLRLLFGRSGFGWSHPFVVIKHLDTFQWLREAEALDVLVQQIPVSKWAAHPHPDIVRTRIEISGNELLLNFPELGLSEAMYLELSPAKKE